jgi:hypothetical protein
MGHIYWQTEAKVTEGCLWMASTPMNLWLLYRGNLIDTFKSALYCRAGKARPVRSGMFNLEFYDDHLMRF